MALGPTRSSQEAFPAAPFAAKRRCPSALSTSCCISGGHCCSSGDIPAHPPLSLPKRIGGPQGSSGRYSHPPAPKIRSQPAGRAGGRALPLGRPTDGQGALARASHNSCAEGIARHAPPAEGAALPQKHLLAALVALLLGRVSSPTHVGRPSRTPETTPLTRPCRCQSTLSVVVAPQEVLPPALVPPSGRAAATVVPLARHNRGTLDAPPRRHSLWR